jgi:thioredoxin 1
VAPIALPSVFETLNEVADFQAALRGHAAVLAYFSTPDCNVCKVLKPKVAALVAREFPRIRCVYVDCTASPLIAGQHRVFTVPTVLVFFDGREWLRMGRGLGLGELREALARPYGMLFGDAE